MRSLAIVYLGLAVLAPLFALAQRVAPDGVPPRALAQHRKLDWLYWLVTPIGTGILTRAVTLALAAGAALAIGVPAAELGDLLGVFQARTPLPFGALPLAAQLALAIVIADFVAYWSHRLRHRAGFFPLHSVHHSARELDWLAAARMHPLDDLADNVVVTLPILLLGFDPLVFVALGPLFLLHTLFLHAAFRCPLGPLRYVFVGPDLHRWHHATDPAAQRKNFGNVLALWDVLFGTFHLPRDRRPEHFGLAPEDALPDTLGAHLAQPVARLAHRRPR